MSDIRMGGTPRVDGATEIIGPERYVHLADRWADPPGGHPADLPGGQGSWVKEHMRGGRMVAGFWRKTVPAPGGGTYKYRLAKAEGDHLANPHMSRHTIMGTIDVPGHGPYQKGSDTHAIVHDVTVHKANSSGPLSAPTHIVTTRHNVNMGDWSEPESWTVHRNGTVRPLHGDHKEKTVASPMLHHVAHIAVLRHTQGLQYGPEPERPRS